MPASASYLTKYLTASNTTGTTTSNADFEDSTRLKKWRKKDKSIPSTTLVIADDDEDLSLSSRKNRRRSGADEDEEDGPTMYAGNVRSAEFRKKKESGWKAVRTEDSEEQAGTNDGRQTGRERGGEVDEADEADRILAQAANESAARAAEVEMDDAPALVDSHETPADAAPKMSSGAKAGLQTAADTAALLAAETAHEQQEKEATNHKKRKSRRKDNHHEEETAEDRSQATIYRDATGRRIDVSLARSQARAAEAAKLADEKKERESAMGDVQLRQREERKQELEEAKFLTLGRTADDKEMNERMRGEVRWDDPMAEYMAERQAERGGRREKKSRREDGGEGEAGAAQVRRKEYAGAAAPNRYGIKPGWRWDGVDRGNGFEKEWFQARGKKQRNEKLEYQWAMDE